MKLILRYPGKERKIKSYNLLKLKYTTVKLKRIINNVKHHSTNTNENS